MKPINEMSQDEKWKHIETTWTLQECLDGLDDMSVITDGYEPDYPTIEAITYRIRELTRWIPVEERMPTEEDVMNTNADIHSYMNGLVLWLVAHESGRLDYVLSKWYMPPSTYNKLLAWRRINTP
jgi:hypothetical protein